MMLFPARLTDWEARVLIHAADTVASRSRLPNPMAATRVVLTELSTPELSGADFIDTVTWQFTKLGFTWPSGLCETCGTDLTEEQAQDDGLCASCGPWVCACAFDNPGSQESRGGCHLTRAGQGEPMPPCACGCDPSQGDYGDYDTESSVSRQHFIDSGRFLRPGEVIATA
ncbi:hypothetical protein OS965_41495 [Streptomyces sp. H27-G5]|uniref:hypothetical protein n=1 Tax=Streptomyces sp. H27-G5 TaxID=2996698 RepID=UPI002270727A|nr:hypothetical protein [Streptomyces sp. H27-G5]MCY0924480.1 hypothetical protein [Streptomyces sp. H27-G5]